LTQTILRTLNNCMDDKDIKKESNRGGIREGAGRPSGSKNKVNKATVQTVLDMLYDKTGRVYEDLLLEDFLNARQSNEGLALKYHNLLANKLMPTLNEITVENIGEAVDGKKQAFIEAVQALKLVNSDININKSKDDSDASN
jgi:hypothetical protein